jgi:hypothetical protein
MIEVEFLGIDKELAVSDLMYYEEDLEYYEAMDIVLKELYYEEM